jgi:hypothetical protein
MNAQVRLSLFAARLFMGNKKTRFSYEESGFFDFLILFTTVFWCRLPESNWRPFHYE